MNKKVLFTGLTLIVVLSLSIALWFIPFAAGATAGITLTPTSQSAEGLVSVSGTGFNSTAAVAIGFGAEVAVTGEVISIETGSGLGPYKSRLSSYPVKPGTYRLAVTVTNGVNSSAQVWDNGVGALASDTPYFASGTINYTTGEIVRSYFIDLTGFKVTRIANYTRYQYNVTNAVGVTASASGSFTASITVPAVASGDYNVTAIDTAGNRAVSSLNVESSAGWNKTYGGTGNEVGAGAIVQASDGGYTLAGETASIGAGGYDTWLVKTDAAGIILWTKTYGGLGNDQCADMFKTGSGYIIAGATNSYGVGGKDFWLVKTDNSGNIQWNKTYGGTGDEFAFAVIQTSDGGYALAGNTSSFGAGQSDFWLVKTDNSGNIQWNKTYGGTGQDEGRDVVQTSDGGYAITGNANSFGAGGMDGWLVKTDSAGSMLWNKSYGGTGGDYTYSLAVTPDGGYALAGYTSSFGGVKAYVVKTDSSGTMLWNKTYGGTYVGLELIQAADGGYALTGWTYANGQDFFLVKTDASGTTQWEKAYGGAGIENAYHVIQTSDGGFALMGHTTSFGAGGQDIYLVKVDPSGAIPELPSWLLLSLALSATGFIARGKKKLFCRH